MQVSRLRAFSEAFTTTYERYLFLIVPCTLLLGLLFPSFFHPMIAYVPFVFGYITFVMALGCSFAQMREPLRQPLQMGSIFVLTHVAAPAVAYLLGILIFGQGSPYVIGMVLFAAIPLGVSSVIWVGLSGGSVPFMLTMILFDSAVSPIVVPVLIKLYFGSTIHFDYIGMMRDLLLIVVIPVLAGVTLHYLTKGWIIRKVSVVTAPTSKLAFQVVLLANASAISPHLHTVGADAVQLIAATVLLVACCYGMGIAGAALFEDKRLPLTYAYASGMRNNSLGIVIASAYFTPMAAVPVVMSILVQQPMATLVHTIMKRFKIGLQ